MSTSKLPARPSLDSLRKQAKKLARDIAARHSQKSATTEDLRQALVHYRALFADLLEVPHQPARRSA